MPSPECLEESAKRLDRTRNRLAWQKRFLGRATDPAVLRVAERMVSTLEEIVETMSEAHDLLVQQARRQRRDSADTD